MKIDKLTKIYFSPTNTTQQIIEAISKGLEIKNNRTINLTKPKVRQNFKLDIDSINELLIIGVPVYEERIPEVIEKSLANLSGQGQPVILIVLYGNIGEGIALKQLKTLVEENEFNVIGAGSFIGEHSFSNNELKIAKGRPDKDDFKKAIYFGKEIIRKIKTSNNIENFAELDIQGKLPLIAKILPRNSAKIFAEKPKVNNKKCSRCGICVNACPVGAIDKKELKINDDICLRCFACVKKCPKEARKIDFKKSLLVKFILRKKGKIRKEPKIYF